MSAPELDLDTVVTRLDEQTRKTLEERRHLPIEERLHRAEADIQLLGKALNNTISGALALVSDLDKMNGTLNDVAKGMAVIHRIFLDVYKRLGVDVKGADIRNLDPAAKA